VEEEMREVIERRRKREREGEGEGEGERGEKREEREKKRRERERQRKRESDEMKRQKNENETEKLQRKPNTDSKSEQISITKNRMTGMRVRWGASFFSPLSSSAAPLVFLSNYLGCFVSLRAFPLISSPT